MSARAGGDFGIQQQRRLQLLPRAHDLTGPQQIARVVHPQIHHPRAFAHRLLVAGPGVLPFAGQGVGGGQPPETRGVVALVFEHPRIGMLGPGRVASVPAQPTQLEVDPVPLLLANPGPRQPQRDLRGLPPLAAVPHGAGMGQGQHGAGRIAPRRIGGQLQRGLHAVRNLQGEDQRPGGLLLARRPIQGPMIGDGWPPPDPRARWSRRPG